MVKRHVALVTAALSLSLLIGSAFQVVTPDAQGLLWASGVLGLLIGLGLVLFDRKRGPDFS